MKMADIVVNQSLHQKRQTKEILGKEGIILPSHFCQLKMNGKRKTSYYGLPPCPIRNSQNCFWTYKKPEYRRLGSHFGGGPTIKFTNQKSRSSQMAFRLR